MSLTAAQLRGVRVTGSAHSEAAGAAEPGEGARLGRPHRVARPRICAPGVRLLRHSLPLAAGDAASQTPYTILRSGVNLLLELSKELKMTSELVTPSN